MTGPLYFFIALMRRRKVTNIGYRGINPLFLYHKGRERYFLSSHLPRVGYGKVTHPTPIAHY